MAAADYLLFETASGFGLFEHIASEDIGALTDAAQAGVVDLSRFSKAIKLKAFLPFTAAENALEVINDISEGILHDDLKNFLEMQLPKTKKGQKSSYTLGVIDAKLGNSIQEEMGISCRANDKVTELLRGIRLHFTTYIKGLKSGDLEKAQLGLAHSYSRSKVKFNVHRADNMIIQAISLLDQLDKDINTFAMRCKEWYSWHFPELSKLITDNVQYTRTILAINRKEEVVDEMASELERIYDDPEKARIVIEAAHHSMGNEFNDFDLDHVKTFAKRVESLAAYRAKLSAYLSERMRAIAPNLTTLVGEIVGARLIAHAGSLTNLAKYPASTVQILGAEKALFRALKTRGNTPKYGLIFHSTFITRAGTKNKGRISRYLANKCSIAARIDCFSEEANEAFGAKLRDQVEERLRFYDTGDAPRKNIDVMREAIEEISTALGNKSDKKEKKDKKKKKDDDEEMAEAADSDDEGKKKKKKDKKRKEPEPEEEDSEEEKKSKKDKKKDKKKEKKASSDDEEDSGESKKKKKRKD